MTNPAVGMPCPVCKGPLVMSDRSAQDAAPAAPPERGYEELPYDGDDDDRHRDHRHHRNRRRSFFEDLFD